MLCNTVMCTTHGHEICTQTRTVQKKNFVKQLHWMFLFLKQHDCTVTEGIIL